MLQRALQLCLVMLLAAAGSAGAVQDAEPGAGEAVWRAPFEARVAEAKANMMGDPAAARSHAAAAELAIPASDGSPYADNSRAVALWLQAEAHMRMNDTRPVEALLGKALEAAAQDGHLTKIDADLALTKGRFAAATGRVDVALTSFQSAHEQFLALGEARSQAIALQSLGAIYSDARDFARVLEYYDRSGRVFPGDPALELSSANNRGFALKELGRHDESLKAFESAIAIAEKMASPVLKARIMTNLGGVYLSAERPIAAEKIVDEALALMKQAGDESWAPFVYGVKAKAALDQGETARARALIAKTFQGLDPRTTPAPFRDMHEFAYQIYRGNGEPAEALKHHEAFKRLDDAGRALSASTNLALMSAQFDLTAKQLEIEQLERGQLQKDIELQRARTQQQRIALLGLLALFGFVMGALVVRNRAERRHNAEMRTANDRLRESISELNDEMVLRERTEANLRIAREAAEGASRAKTQFLANMSHELRTPLNAIIGFSEIMEGEIMGALGSPLYKSYSGDILKSGRHLLAIFSDILEMAMLDAGKLTLNKERVDLTRTAREALAAFEERAAAEGKSLALHAPAAAVFVRGDQAYLRQILVALLSNAVRFTSRDRGRIEVAIAPSEGGGLRVTVGDNGIGIEAEKIAIVLQPFGQVEDAFAREHGGVGLGLAMSNALVALHGGTLQIESELQVGTRVIAAFPAEFVDPSPQPALGAALEPVN